MTNLQTFNNETLGASIRVIEIDGEPWFIANDVCRTLGMHINSKGQPNVTMACRHLHPDEVGFNLIEIDTSHFAYRPKNHQRMRVISESGLYKLIMRSDKPVARPFQEWVTREVLPSIRKHGVYHVDQDKVARGEMSFEEMTLKVVEGLRAAVEEKQRKIEKLEAENKEMSDELNYVTVDEWRALNHIYLQHGAKVMLGQMATDECLRQGIKKDRQTRTIKKNGRLIRTVVGVYPRYILDAVWRDFRQLLSPAA